MSITLNHDVQQGSLVELENLISTLSIYK